MKYLPMLALAASSVAYAQTKITNEAAILSVEPEYITAQCAQNGHYNDEYTKAIQWAVEYSYSTWDTTGFDFEPLKDEIKGRYSEAKFDSDDCASYNNYLMAYYYQALNTYNLQQSQQRINQLEQQVAILNGRLNRANRIETQPAQPTTVQCKQFGTFISEVKTFNGSICPVGWTSVN